jgi:hypothetical protein
MTQWGLDTLFNPAKRHMDEEKRRLQSTREEVGDNSGGNRIDLESGKVVIRRRSESDDTESETGEPSPAEGESALSDRPENDKPDTARSDESPATRRARERIARARARRSR